MATRSNIIVHTKGTWKKIYCHWDGYISGVGATLFEHYNSQARAEELVKGDISSLGPRCDKPEGHSWSSAVEGYTVYYGRDRGEEDADAQTGASLQDVWPAADGSEFVYVWQGGWFVGNPDNGPQQNLIPLGEAIEIDAAGENPIKSAVKAPWGVIGQRT